MQKLDWSSIMNFRYFIGSSIDSAVHWLLSRSYFPLTRYVPRGRYWLYDIQRFSETKDISVIFDVGANIGQTLSSILRYFPESNIFSFEPISSSFNALCLKFGHVENVRLEKLALGSKSGTSIVELHQNSELNTLVSDQPRKDDFLGETETVSIESLDAFCRSVEISWIDILKMDVQGWELEVLRGAKSLIESKKIRYIYAEVGFRRCDSDMQHFSDLNDFLEEKGYWLCGFYEPFRWGRNKQFVGFANALYVHPDFVAVH